MKKTIYFLFFILISSFSSFADENEKVIINMFCDMPKEVILKSFDYELTDKKREECKYYWVFLIKIEEPKAQEFLKNVVLKMENREIVLTDIGVFFADEKHCGSMHFEESNEKDVMTFRVSVIKNPPQYNSIVRFIKNYKARKKINELEKQLIDIREKKRDFDLKSKSTEKSKELANEDISKLKQLIEEELSTLRKILEIKLLQVNNDK